MRLRNEYGDALLQAFVKRHGVAVVVAHVIFGGRILDDFERGVMVVMIGEESLGSILERLDEINDSEPRCPVCGSVAGWAFRCKAKFHDGADVLSGLS